MSPVTDPGAGNFILGIFSQMYVRLHHKFVADFDSNWFVTCTDCGQRWKAIDDAGHAAIDGVNFVEVT